MDSLVEAAAGVPGAWAFMVHVVAPDILDAGECNNTDHFLLRRVVDMFVSRLPKEFQQDAVRCLIHHLSSLYGPGD